MKVSDVAFSVSLSGIDFSAILVVVSIIQMRLLRTELEKGSMRTALGHGLAEPKKK